MSRGCIGVQRATLLVIFLLCWVTSTDSLVLRARTADVDPDEGGGDGKKSLEKFIGKKLAKKYVHTFKQKEWQRNRCLEKELPEATQAMTKKYCEEAEDRGPCVCMVAKAHSCHVGCVNKLQEKMVQQAMCPTACEVSVCKAGDPKNGGLPLSGGFEGTCQHFCSQPYGDGFRFCGEGPVYMSGSNLDCTRCDPSKDQSGQTVMVSQGYTQKSELSWTDCMADCYPNPTCQEMCQAGSPECKENCYKRYEEVVKPFQHMFASSDTQVPDFKP